MSQPSRLTRHNGAALRYFRIKSGMKPNELATKAQTTYPTLDNLENERKNASVELIYRLAAALDIPPRAIVRDPAFLLRQTEQAS